MHINHNISIYIYNYIVIVCYSFQVTQQPNILKPPSIPSEQLQVSSSGTWPQRFPRVSCARPRPQGRPQRQWRAWRSPGMAICWLLEAGMEGWDGGMATLGVKRDPKMSSLIYPQDLLFFLAYHGISHYIPMFVGYIHILITHGCWLDPTIHCWLFQVDEGEVEPRYPARFWTTKFFFCKIYQET